MNMHSSTGWKTALGDPKTDALRDSARAFFDTKLEITGLGNTTIYDYFCNTAPLPDKMLNVGNIFYDHMPHSYNSYLSNLNHRREDFTASEEIDKLMRFLAAIEQIAGREGHDYLQKICKDRVERSDSEETQAPWSAVLTQPLLYLQREENMFDMHKIFEGERKGYLANLESVMEAGIRYTETQLNPDGTLWYQAERDRMSNAGIPIICRMHEAYQTHLQSRLAGLSFP